MSPLSIAYLTMVIVAFLSLAVSLLWVYFYTNAKDPPDQMSKAQLTPLETDEAEKLRRAA